MNTGPELFSPYGFAGLSSQLFSPSVSWAILVTVVGLACAFLWWSERRAAGAPKWLDRLIHHGARA